LRRIGYKGPIVAVSATINEEACLEAGMTDFLYKPISKASVLAIVEKCLAAETQEAQQG
jgi:CheY-like chemotaxis protein